MAQSSDSRDAWLERGKFVIASLDASSHHLFRRGRILTAGALGLALLVLDMDTRAAVEVFLPWSSVIEVVAWPSYDYTAIVGQAPRQWLLPEEQNTGVIWDYTQGTFVNPTRDRASEGSAGDGE